MKVTAQTYQQLIIEGIKDLPEETLAEVAHFVFFMRKKASEPSVFEDELWGQLIEMDLKQCSHDEDAHLEQEFADYDRLYPRE